MQVSYEHFYFQASSRPQYSFKRLHQGFKHVRSAYASHISRPQPHGVKTVSTWLSMTSRRCLDSLRSSKGREVQKRGPEGVQGGSLERGPASQKILYHYTGAASVLCRRFQ